MYQILLISAALFWVKQQRLVTCHLVSFFEIGTEKETFYKIFDLSVLAL